MCYLTTLQMGTSDERWSARWPSPSEGPFFGLLANEGENRLNFATMGRDEIKSTDRAINTVRSSSTLVFNGMFWQPVV
jgi:hypothetical protein